MLACLYQCIYVGMFLCICMYVWMMDGLVHIFFFWSRGMWNQTTLIMIMSFLTQGENVCLPFFFSLPPSFIIPTTVVHSYTYTHPRTHTHTLTILIHPHFDICTHKQDLYPTSLVLEPFSNDDETEAEGAKLEHEEKGICGGIFN